VSHQQNRRVLQEFLSETLKCVYPLRLHVTMTTDENTFELSGTELDAEMLADALEKYLDTDSDVAHYHDFIIVDDGDADDCVYIFHDGEQVGTYHYPESLLDRVNETIDDAHSFVEYLEENIQHPVHEEFEVSTTDLGDAQLRDTSNNLVTRAIRRLGDDENVSITAVEVKDDELIVSLNDVRESQ